MKKKYFLFFTISYLLTFFLACTDDTDSFTLNGEEEIPDIDEAIVDKDEHMVDAEEEIVEVLSFNNSNEYGFGIVDEDVEIAVWNDFKLAAITHTWDDSSTNQIEVAIPIFDSYGFNTTLFTLPNKISDWTKHKEAFANGHEIASHSISHSSFATISEEEITNELSISKELITDNMDYNDCLTFSYPYCRDESFGLTEQYYIAARECNNKMASRSPDDFMKISSYICGGGTNYETSEDFNAIASNVLSSKAWGIYLFHAIDQGSSLSITSEILINHLNFLKENEALYWVSSFLTIVKYIKERDASEIHVVTDTIDEIVLNITDDLDNSIYDLPITIKKKIPLSWYSKVLQLVQADEILDYKLVSIDGVQFVIFNATPDIGNVTITLK